MGNLATFEEPQNRRTNIKGKRVYLSEFLHFVMAVNRISDLGHEASFE